MSKLKRTYGEWWAGSEEDSNCVYATHGGDETELVCETTRDDGDREKEAANARFIACGPKLLTACDRMWAARHALEVGNPEDQQLLREMYNAWLDLRDARNEAHGHC